MLMATYNLPSILRSIEDGLEEHGIDNRFLSAIGIGGTKMGFRVKSHIKIYLPKNEVEAYQVLAIYLKLKNVSIASFTRGLLRDELKKLIEAKDPLLEQAKIMQKEIKEQVLRKSMGR